MATGVRKITKGRMKEWASNLVQKRHTPILVVGMGHDQAQGQLSVISVESLTNQELEHSLQRAIDFIRERPEPDGADESGKPTELEA